VEKWAPALLLLATLALSIAFSPWWNPWEYSLSALGSASNGVGGALFNGGLALTGISLTKIDSELIKTVGVLTVLVAAINIDFGLAHFAVAALLFVLLFTYILLHGDLLGASVSAALWASHWLLGVPPGIAIPELATIAFAAYHLLLK